MLFMVRTLVLKLSFSMSFWTLVLYLLLVSFAKNVSSCSFKLSPLLSLPPNTHMHTHTHTCTCMCACILGCPPRTAPRWMLLDFLLPALCCLPSQVLPHELLLDFKSCNNCFPGTRLASVSFSFGFCIWLGGSDSKGSACNVGDPGSVPGSGRSPGEGNGYLLQYSCLENSMGRGTWLATVHGVTWSQTRMSD